jgi:hypothetical protein
MRRLVRAVLALVCTLTLLLGTLSLTRRAVTPARQTQSAQCMLWFNFAGLTPYLCLLPF